MDKKINLVILFCILIFVFGCYILILQIQSQAFIDRQCVLKNRDKIVEMKNKCIQTGLNGCQFETYKYFNCIKN